MAFVYQYSAGNGRSAFSSGGLAFAVLIWAQWEGRRVRAVVDSTANVLTVGTLLGIASLTLVNPGSGGGVELVPFRDMAASGLGATGMYQNGGNVALFMPLGTVLPRALGGWFSRWGRVLAAAAAVSVTVEVLQCLLATGRVSSVDDALLSCAGALLGACATRPWWRISGRVGQERS